MRSPGFWFTTEAQILYCLQRSLERKFRLLLREILHTLPARAASATPRERRLREIYGVAQKKTRKRRLRLRALHGAREFRHPR